MATRDQLIEALRKADAAGDVEGVNRIVEMLKKPTAKQKDVPIGTFLQDVGRQALQGLTLGFSDEIGSGIAAGVAKLAGDDKPISEIYNDMLSAERFRDKQFAAENPKTALAAQLGGGLLTGGTGAVRTGATKSLPKLAAFGAGTGAIGGAGTAEGGLPEIAQDVAQGAAMGGILGAAIPAAGAGIGRLGQFIADPVSNRLKRSLQGILKDSDISAEEAADMMNRNPSLLLGDLSENLRSRTAGVANLPGKAQEQAKKVLEERTTQQSERILPSIKEALGADQKYYEAVETLTSDMKEKARPLYEKAYQTEITSVPDKIEDILNASEKNGALRGARRLAEAELKDYDDMLAFQGLDYLKRALQDIEGQAIRSGRNQVASGIGAQRRALGDYLKEKSPEYERANKIWSSGRGDQDAMEAGLAAINKPADFNRSALSKMTESEKKSFKVGLMQGIQNKVSTMAEDRDVVRQLKTIPKNRELLKMAFGNKEKFDKFMDQLEDESMMFDTFSKSLRGSRTAPLMASQGAVNDMSQGVLSSALAGNVTPMLSPLLRATTGRFSQPLEQRSESFRGLLSDALLDREAGMRALDEIMNPQSLLSQGTPLAYPLLGGAGGASVVAQNNRPVLPQ